MDAVKVYKALRVATYVIPVVVATIAVANSVLSSGAVPNSGDPIEHPKEWV